MTFWEYVNVILIISSYGYFPNLVFYFIPADV